MSRRFTRAPLLILLLLFAAAAALADVDRGTIEAVALDPGKAPLPGVTVTVTRPETGFSTVAVTDSSGLARFVGLVPGTYEVEFALEGFASLKNRVVLRVGETAKLGVTMQAAASEVITVSADSVVVDVHKTDSSTNIVPEQIEALPVANREFERLAFLAPGVQRERGGFRFITGGPVIGAGGNASQATVFVNGVDMTDQVNGLSRARFSQDAVREFRVIANRFDVEVGGSAGGALSVVTRSGTNDLHGSVLGFFRDAALREKGALDLEKNDDYSRRQIGFTAGGPIARDRAFYFASLEVINEDDIALFRPGGAFASRAADIPKPVDQTLLFASADFNLDPQMTGGINGVYEKYDLENFRVGGVADESYGQKLERRNWNFIADHNWSIGPGTSNQARLQYGKRRYFEPTNSDAVAEWFSSGNTLQTGGNILGDLLGDGSTWELRNTFHHHIPTAGGSHDLKAGFSAQFIEERFVLDTYATGLFIYLTDTRQLPLVYAYGVGSSDVTTDTNIYGLFVEDQWRPNPRLAVNFGLRYDLDTNGNNEGFTHPLIPEPRDADTDNFQPRLSFSFDLRGDGTNVLRGGAGKYVGRYLLVPALQERQLNGVTGRVTYTRINGALLGLPALALDPNNPTTTGIPSKPSINLLSPDYHQPESTQASVGYTLKLGRSRLYFDTEAIWVEGDDEIIIHDRNWSGNATRTRPYTQYNNVNMYENLGRSEYKALVFSLNGNIRASDLITASVTFADKKNISDDFSPDFTTGYPNDPADMEAEWGHARGHERYRIVLSGVFHAPWGLTVAPIYEYGSGQPWTHRLGYDWNGDGFNSDRPAGVRRNEESGPPFRQLSLRLTKAVRVPIGQLDLIAEGFNLTNAVNYDVQSIVSGEFLSGPTAANPNAAAVRNPRFGRFNATLPAREFQLGVRWVF
ncbi:MAG TPA: TonB-dependent receptor [Thermoanaerobaculia bacterium]|nr:TonB-dependent receptor [Thermoanaerobaculia bacterium]